MSGLFSKPKIPTPAPPAPTPPPPTVVEDTQEEVDEQLKYRRSKLSRPKAIITGDLTPNTGTKRLLG